MFYFWAGPYHTQVVSDLHPCGNTMGGINHMTSYTPPGHDFYYPHPDVVPDTLPGWVPFSDL